MPIGENGAAAAAGCRQKRENTTWMCMCFVHEVNNPWPFFGGQQEMVFVLNSLKNKKKI